MTEKEIIGRAADALTEKAKFSITIPVSWYPELPTPEPLPIPKITFVDKILRKTLPVIAPDPLPELETERELVFYPCKVANMSRIARTALLLPEEMLSEELNAAVLPLIADGSHLDNMIYIIAAAVQNNHMEPSNDLITFIKMNMDHEDMFLCMHQAFGSLGMQSFLNSIVLAKGTITVLKPEASPQDGSESIASHTAQ